ERTKSRRQKRRGPREDLERDVPRGAGGTSAYARTRARAAMVRRRRVTIVVKTRRIMRGHIEGTSRSVKILGGQYCAPKTSREVFQPSATPCSQQVWMSRVSRGRPVVTPPPTPHVMAVPRLFSRRRRVHGIVIIDSSRRVARGRRTGNPHGKNSGKNSKVVEEIQFTRPVRQHRRAALVRAPHFARRRRHRARRLRRVRLYGQAHRGAGGARAGAPSAGHVHRRYRREGAASPVR